MSQKALDIPHVGDCSHEFSWPRRGADGQYYQTCQRCASEYKYDWKTMRRLERVERAADAAQAGDAEPKPGWKPRSRRLKLAARLRYRGKNLTAWYEGRIENLSQSGVLIHGAEQLPQESVLEMIFEMPEEISGQKNSTVLCEGKILRSKPRYLEDDAEMAVAILDYKYLRPS